MRARHSVALGLLAAACAVSACGGGDSGSPTQPVTRTEAKPETTEQPETTPVEVHASCPPIPRSPQRPARPTEPGDALFAPDAVWNTRLDGDAPLDPRSPELVASLARQAAKEGASFANGDYGVPLYTVGPEQPCVEVDLINRNDGLRDALREVPIPKDARPAAGTDAHLAIWQPATDTYWEFFRMRRRDGGWQAQYGGRVVGVSSSPGFYQRLRGEDGEVVEEPFWGATATSLPLAGGLVTFEDLERGPIDHALSMAVPNVDSKERAFPARRSDGATAASDAIPEGARFRLDPDIDLERLPLSPFGMKVAKALQDYGVIVRDGGGVVGIYGQVPFPGAPDPWKRELGRLRHFEVLDGIPWKRMQLMRMRLTSR